MDGQAACFQPAPAGGACPGTRAGVPQPGGAHDQAVLLAGTPVHSNGALTVVALAQEAQVPRNALTQRHVDLKNAFYDEIRSRKAVPESELRLGRRLARLSKLRDAEAEELRQLKIDNEALVGALHQAQMENRKLREELAAPAPRLRAIPGHPRPE